MKNKFNLTANVGVVIPCYNSSATLSRCLDSVYAQSMPVKKVILYVDGGEDISATYEIFTKYQRCYRNISFSFSTKNMGAAYARNQCLQYLKFVEFIAFIDADDVWFPEKIETQYNYMVSNNIDISGHLYFQDLNRFNQIKISEPSILTVDNFLLGSPLFTPTIMIKNIDIQYFNPIFRSSEDWLFTVHNLIKNNSTKCHRIEIFLGGGFKPAMGHNGASSSVTKCHLDRVLALFSIHKSIPLQKLFLALAIEYIKYPIRLIRYKLL